MEAAIPRPAGMYPIDAIVIPNRRPNLENNTKNFFVKIKRPLVYRWSADWVGSWLWILHFTFSYLSRIYPKHNDPKNIPNWAAATDVEEIHKFSQTKSNWNEIDQS